jgi:F-type H+-transporting ATPase subunit b
MLTLNLNLLYTVVNILVLFVLLRKFLYRPVMNVIEQRQKQIDDAIADAQVPVQACHEHHRTAPEAGG